MYKRFLKSGFFIVFPILFTFAFAQSGTGSNKFEVGAVLSNNIGYRFLKHNDSDPANDFVLEQRNEMEVPKHCYSAGITVSYKLNADARISSGIRYSNKGYQTKKIPVQSVFPDPSAPQKAKLRYNINYIDVPLLFSYHFGKGKWRFLAGGGVTTNVFLNERQQIIKYFDNKVEKTSEETEYNYNRFNFSPEIDLEVVFDAHERFYLYAGPTFTYGVLKIIDTPVTAYLFTGGINFGIQIK